MSKDNNHYYVYVHRRKDNNVVFYVGHGRGRRIYSSGKTKTKDWLLIQENAGGHTVEKLNENLNKSEAEIIESNYITNAPDDWELVNKRLPIKVYELDYEYLNTKFEYSEESETGLKWKGSKFPSFNGRNAGHKQKTSGNKSKSYWCVRDSKRLYLNHRIIWVLFNKTDIPTGFVIDHIDGDPTNNKINNLRLLTQQQNSISKRKGRGLSNIAGVLFETKLSGLYWTARISVNSINHSKSYSVKKHGDVVAKELAIAKRLEFELEFQPK